MGDEDYDGHAKVFMQPKHFRMSFVYAEIASHGIGGAVGTWDIEAEKEESAS